MGDQTLHYTATCGLIPLQDEDKAQTTARLFFTAYTLDGVDRQRAAPAGVRLQRRAGIVVGVAAPGRDWPPARRDAGRGLDARAALPPRR